MYKNKVITRVYIKTILLCIRSLYAIVKTYVTYTAYKNSYCMHCMPSGLLLYVLMLQLMLNGLYSFFLHCLLLLYCWDDRFLSLNRFFLGHSETSPSLTPPRVHTST